MTEDFIKRLAEIQLKLDAPKNQWNDFSKFHYRSCEDILEGVKPLLNGLILNLSDDVVCVGDRIYVKATATLTDGVSTMVGTAMARESLTKKGMDDSQVTGTASSYARKYALNGLFCIDDEKDSDSQDNRPKKQSGSNKVQASSDDKPWYNEPNYQSDLQNITQSIRGGMPSKQVIDEISKTFKISNKYRDLINQI